jgi:GNAT superfamily N-acetyltransferase
MIIQNANKNNFLLRPLVADDREAFCELIYSSFNTWYRQRGLSDQYFRCPQEDLGIIYDIYQDMDPDLNIAAIEKNTGRLMGACFYHPRKHHISLGIMAVHPDFWKQKVASALYEHIIRYTDSEGYSSLRIVQSACNVESFSLYTRGGASPRQSYHDMIFEVPSSGIPASQIDPEIETSRVREGTLEDIPAMGKLEMQVSGIIREQDYRYCLENRLGIWHTSVLEKKDGNGLAGFMISCGHPSFNMLGPCVAETEEAAGALVLKELDLYRGRTPLFIVPADKQKLVHLLYDLGAKNIEVHFYQVRGEFKGFQGVSMPTFLPETG